MEIESQMVLQQHEYIDILAEAAERKQEPIAFQLKKQKPQPIANPQLTLKILGLLQQLLPLKQVKKGVNEILKQIPKNAVEFIIIAADCDPIQIVMTLPIYCTQRSIPFCFVESKHALGRACGIKRPIGAAAVVCKEGSALQGPIMEIKDQLEQLFI